MFSLVIKSIFTVLQAIFCVLMFWYAGKDYTNRNTSYGVMTYLLILTVVMWL